MSAASSCLWKKLSLAFFHEVDRRKRPRRGPGWRFLGQHPPHPAADHFIHSLLDRIRDSLSGELVHRWVEAEGAANASCPQRRDFCRLLKPFPRLQSKANSGP